MNVKLILPVLLLPVVFFACKKSSTPVTPVTPVSTTANIDSITGYYIGTTSGDSIYTYLDSATGVVKQLLQSFSWPDTLLVTSADTANITATSRFYTISYFYGDSLTVDSMTTLQNETFGQGNYITYNTTLVDTANSINHLTINVWYSYTKHLNSVFTLYKRQ